ncbi:MAG: aspartyl protease family protein [Armatimonadetes bacterium]|nr:aspartyl protease family protein [Armatimonadota bacterium]
MMIASLFALLSSPALLQRPTVDQVLDNVRSAVGYSAIEPFESGIEMTGSALFMGTDANFRFVFTPDGKYLFEMDGPIRATQAWDGERGWELDVTGSPMPVYFSDVEYQHATSWVIGHRWLAPDGPYDITMIEEDSDSYTLNLKPKAGRMSVKVEVDRESWLPKASSYMDGDIMHLIELSQWETTRGFKLPHRIDVTFSSGKGWISVEHVRPTPDGATSLFEMPAWLLTDDTTYDEANEGVVETMRAESGHVLVRPTIMGEDVGWFILDTGGGGMVVGKKLVERLGAEEFGSWFAIAEGGTLPLTFTKFDDFSLGPATVAELTFAVLDLSPVSLALGIELGGIVGYDFFRRTVLEIDVEESMIAFFDPRSYELKKGNWNDLLLLSHHPTTPAKFEGAHEGVFMIDTGAPYGLVFSWRVVKELNLLEGRETLDGEIHGLGGAVPAKFGFVEYFEIDGYRFEDQLAIMLVSNRSAYASEYLTGLIGIPLLMPFTVVFDYANSRIAFVRKEG